MLVKFSSPASADMMMFEEVAHKLIQLMGHSDSIPGSIPEEDIAQALERLSTAVGAESSPAQGNAVNLRQRAFPLLEMLKRAQRDETYIMWGAA